MTRKVLYMAHPMAPTDRELAEIPYSTMERGRGEYEPDIEHQISESRRISLAVRANVQRALRWLSWLSASFPEVTFIAPWIAGVLAVHGDWTPEKREAGLVDDCAVIERCNGIVLVGGRISNGMQRVMAHGILRHDNREVFWYSAKFAVHDLTGLGMDPPSGLCNMPRGGSHANEAERSLICLSRMGPG